MEPISADFEKELALLREKLEEAEDVRRAITRGEVEAFVVGPGGSGRVLLLANAYQRYRQLVERMQQGAVTATATGHILFANQRFSDMLGVPLAQLYTAPLESYVGVSDRARLSAFLMVSARDSRVEVELGRRDGSSIPVRMSLASFADGYASLLVTDMRPLQWPSMAVEALDSIRTSLEKLNHDLGGSDVARDSLRNISEEINGLARMIDEMIDVEGRRDADRKG
jgi:PAS domain S-box-containing protein